MFDIGWQELMVLGVLALLVVGPKELPGLLRTAGQWAGRARSMARDFQRSMEDAAREADLDEIRNFQNIKRDVENMARLDPAEQARRSQPPARSGPTRTDAAAAPVAEAPAPSAAAAPEAGGSPPSDPAPKTAGAAGGAASET